MSDFLLQVLKVIVIALGVVLIGPALMLVLFIDLWLVHLMGVG